MLNVKNTDWSFLLTTVALLTLGLIMIYSSSAIEAYQLVGETPYFFQRQLIWVLLSLVVCFFTMLLPLEFIKRVTPLAYMAVILLLLAVLAPGLGTATRGSRRWFDFGLFSFQPAEAAKISVILAGALYLTRSDRDELKNFRDLVVICLLGGIPAGLILLQPDLSTAFQVFSTAVILLFVTGFAYRYLVSLGIILLPVLGVVIFTSGYRRARIIAYLNPWGQRLGEGYQALHLRRSLASGGIFGQGLGEGLHRYLPEPFTDSIVAVLGEELGLIGMAILIGLIVFLVFRGITLSLQAPDSYLRILGVTLTALIGLQAFMNIAVVIGLLPTTGVPMPFISYGGTSLLINMTAVGLILNISRRR